MPGLDRPPAKAEGRLGGHGVVYAFMLVSVLTGLSNGVARIALPLYANHLQASSLQIGLLSACQFAGTLLLSLPVGVLIDRVGSQALFQAGGLGGALLYLLLFTSASTPGDLVVAVALFSLVNPLRMVATQAEFLHVIARIGPTKAGWQRASHSVGMFFLGPLAAALCLQVMSYGLTFSLVAAVMLMAVLLGRQALSFSPPAPQQQGFSLSARLRDQWSVVSGHAMLRQSLVIELYSQIAGAYFTGFAVLLGVKVHGLSVLQAAMLVTVQGAAFVLTLLLAGRFTLGLKRQRRIALGFAGMLAALVCLALPWTGPLWAGSLLLGVSTGWLHLVSVECFAQVAADIGKGRTGGLFNMAGPLGGVLGSTIGGWVALHWGYLAGFQWLALGCAILLARQRVSASGTP